MYANTATRIGEAFLSLLSYFESTSLKRYLRKDAADTAQELIAFMKGLGSPSFVDGLTGEGWRIWMEDALSHLTVDKLTVRQTMAVFELLIDKVRSVGGQICVSAANGKIKEVTDDGEDYIITWEQENTFAENDLIRCQTFTGSTLKSYWVEVASVESGKVHIAMQDFDEWGCTPEAGDECVLMGNTSDTDRQSCILLSAAEDGVPRIDVLDGISTTSLEGCMHTRVGCLDGITDTDFPTEYQPEGYGLYSDNAFLKGTFVLSTGVDLLTQFEITEGKISSSVESVKNDLLQGYLYNGAFSNGVSGWQAEAGTVYLQEQQQWIWANGNALADGGTGALLTTDGERKVALIQDSWIAQSYGDMLLTPTAFDTDSDGNKLPKQVTLRLWMKRTAGTTVAAEIKDCTGEGFVATYTPLSGSDTAEADDGEYRQLTLQGEWDGTGTLQITVTGTAYIHTISLADDAIATAAVTQKTLFEQTDKYIKAVAANFDEDGNVLAESSIVTTTEMNEMVSTYFDPSTGELLNKSGLVTTAEGSGIYVQVAQADGTYKTALIGVGVEETDDDGNTSTVIKLTADNIQLEGLVTANGYFKILEDGSIEAVNGKFYGKVFSEDLLKADSPRSVNIELPAVSDGFGYRFLVSGQFLTTQNVLSVTTVEEVFVILRWGSSTSTCTIPANTEEGWIDLIQQPTGLVVFDVMYVGKTQLGGGLPTWLINCVNS